MIPADCQQVFGAAVRRRIGPQSQSSCRIKFLVYGAGWQQVTQKPFVLNDLYNQHNLAYFSQDL